MKNPIKNSLLVLAALVAALMVPAAASAQSRDGFEIDLGTMSVGDSLSDNGSTTSTTHSLFTVDFGYKFTSPLFLGLQYDTDTKTQVSGGATTKYQYGSYGPMIGVHAEGLYLNVTYFMSSQYKLTPASGAESTYTGGTGFQAALGYRFWVSGSVAIAPQFNYRSLHYTTRKVEGSPDQAVDVTYNTFLPYVMFMFML
jgi:hypothetical protein